MQRRRKIKRILAVIVCFYKDEAGRLEFQTAFYYDSVLGAKRCSSGRKDG